MYLFKCKICGGTLEIIENDTIALCEYCGTKQTIPRMNNERRINLYDRANHFRRNNEFDKAVNIYEQILDEDNTDAEAYWSLVLCHYGIEYVKDPISGKRIPTINRTRYTSIFDDENYKAALKYADSNQISIYKAEAISINKIQKEILAISQKEAPFDVFICYKETDNNGSRTYDSVLANELYYQLEQVGIKVFFARITLEDKLGVAYEPFIFAALNTAKVMVVLGTKKEHFNAAWVRNEWSRYLALIKQGQKKTLIPAYKDMDPYDLPDEFSHLQALDMSKLGFMQDLLRGITKILRVDSENIANNKEYVSTENTNIAPLVKRIFMFLEDGEWSNANEYCEKVLDNDPENAYAYLGKLMVDLQVRQEDALKDQATVFDKNNNYKKVIRFGDEELKSKVIGYIDYINVRNERRRLDKAYSSAKEAMAIANTEKAYIKAARFFEQIIEYKDSADLAKTCYGNAEISRKDAILCKAKAKMSGKVIEDYKDAKKLLESIPDWRNMQELHSVCEEQIYKLQEEKIAYERQIENEQKKEEERKRRAMRNKRITLITSVVVIGCIAFLYLLDAVFISRYKYSNAVRLMEDNMYSEAIFEFEKLEGFKDSAELMTECKYNNALCLAEKGECDDAYHIFLSLYDYKDSAERAGEIRLKRTMESLKNIQIGDSIKLGVYGEDNTTIEWILLDIQEGKGFFISKYVIDGLVIDDEWWRWNGSNKIRKWLNDIFWETSFSTTEKELIATVPTYYFENANLWDEDIWTVKKDKICLMSQTEIDKYFDTLSEKKCKHYADYNGVTRDEENNCWWWLLNGYSVSPNGHVASSGVITTGKSIGVRPVLWIELHE